jgi:hypothetical protein
MMKKMEINNKHGERIFESFLIVLKVSYYLLNILRRVVDEDFNFGW